MIGGEVIGIVRRDGEPTLLNVEDGDDSCSVRVIEQAKAQIHIRDKVWWQAGKVMWSPMITGQSNKCGVDFDIQLIRA